MGINRKNPASDASRQLAMDKAAMKISISAPADIVLSPQTQARLATLRPVFNQNLLLRGQALFNQRNLTPEKDAKRKTAGLYVSHFIQALDKAGMRGEPNFNQAQRAFFQLDATNDTLPPLETDDNVYIAGQRVVDGDALRIAAGHPAIPFPTIANVTTKYTDFTDVFGDYNLLKKGYDDAQEAISNMREDVDSLILRIWNEVEAAYSEESAPSKRRNSREWGVAYVVTEGEALSPDEFSMTGKITDITNNNKLEDVIVRLVENDFIVITDNLGNYYLPLQPPGFYTVQMIKTGYEVKEFTGVELVAGTVVTLNAQLVPATPSGTGTVNGTVTQGGNPFQANLTIIAGNTTITTHTQLNGSFSLTGVPVGSQVVTCSPDSNPANFQTKTVVVPAAGTVTVNFAFA